MYRLCANCGASLEGRRSRALYCNQWCKNQVRLKTYRADWLAEMAERPCGHCGKPLVGRRRDSKWCSETCAYRANRAGRAAIKRKHNLKTKYGLDEAAYEQLLHKQGNRCAICRAADPKRPDGKWAVDHDHVTGQVRGLLCSKCNTGIGQLRDDPVVLEAAARYIRIHRRVTSALISPSEIRDREA